MPLEVDEALLARLRERPSMEAALDELVEPNPVLDGAREFDRVRVYARDLGLHFNRSPSIDGIVPHDYHGSGREMQKAWMTWTSYLLKGAMERKKQRLALRQQ